MERTPTSERGAINDRGWEAWNAVPRDGPAVFLVETEAFDQGQIWGEWIELHEDELVRRGQLVGLAAATETGRWAIVDQVGLPVMVPEQFSSNQVDEVLREIGGTA